jgi:large subunit ribosomal protein L25
MENTQIIKATNRAAAEDFIPAVLYGLDSNGKHLNFKMSIEKIPFKKIINKTIFSTVFQLEFNDKKYKVVVKDIQFTPKHHEPIHADFHIVLDKFKAPIPVETINTEICPGVKMGALLYIMEKNLQLVQDVNNYRKTIQIDVSKMGVGDVVWSTDIIPDYKKKVAVAAIIK